MEDKKYCKNCFATLEDDAKFCTACGAPVENESKVEEKPAQPKLSDEDIERILAQKEAEMAAQNPQRNDYYQENKPNPEVSKKNSIISMIFGIISLEFAATAIMPIYAIIFMAVGIVFSVLAKRKSTQYIEEAGAPNAFTKVGRITATIAIPVSIVFGVIGLILTIALLLE
jgi:uncharacterized membrane protein YvbJ